MPSPVQTRRRAARRAKPSRRSRRATRRSVAETSYTMRWPMLRFLTAGESHGQGLVTILEGVPAGLRIDFDRITRDLRRRQGGYGRGRRMAIESDRAEVLSGVRRGRTTGGPIALLIANKDWENWQRTMHVEAETPDGATGASRAAGRAAAAGPRRPRRRAEVRARRHSRRARARQRARNRRAGRRRRASPASCSAPSGVEITSHVTGIGDVLRSPRRSR